MKKNFGNKNLRIGILGGSFDPPHEGHLHISLTAIKKLKLNFVIWAITKKNPLKKTPYNSLQKRINLSKKILKKHNKIKIQYLENKILSNKSIDLIKYLKRKYKKSKMFFLIGSDVLINFHKWTNWQKIPLFLKIIVFERQGFLVKSKKSVAIKKLKANDWSILKFKKINISSSKIRKI